MKVDWGSLIVGQVEFYWSVHLRPRLDGLTDEEFFWEPVGRDVVAAARPGRRDGAGRRRCAGADPAAGDHDRVAHGPRGGGLLLQPGQHVLRRRQRAGRRDDVRPAAPAGGAAGERRRGARPARPVVRVVASTGSPRLSDEELATPLGPRGGYFSKDPMAALIVHLNRETMHHGAEICLLRDLYRARAA